MGGGEMNYSSRLGCICQLFLYRRRFIARLGPATTETDDDLERPATTFPFVLCFTVPGGARRPHTTVLMVEDSSDLPCLLGSDFRYSRCLRASS